MRHDDLLRQFPRLPRLPSSLPPDVRVSLAIAALASAVLLAVVGLLILRLGASA